MKKNRRKILSGSRKILFAILAMFLSLGASAQQITASGQVLDAQNEPLIGVSVQEKGTTNGAITDLDGNFSLNVQQNAILVFSYVGYKSQEMKAARQMKVTLQEDNEVLDEVVVIGYGSVKRKDVTTAISPKIWICVPLYLPDRPFRVRRQVYRSSSPMVRREARCLSVCVVLLQ